MTLSHSYLDSGNSNSFYKDIVTNFLEEFQKFPFGSMPKRDLDCLIFYLFEKYKLIDGNSNRQKAYNLNISETKFKSYIIDSNAKYSKSNQEENLKIILSKLADETKVSMDGDCLVFVEENPVIKADFVQSLKDEGFYTDSSFNNELVKVKIASFLSFALSKNLADKEKILKIINEANSEKIQEQRIQYRYPITISIGPRASRNFPLRGVAVGEKVFYNRLLNKY